MFNLKLKIMIKNSDIKTALELLGLFDDRFLEIRVNKAKNITLSLIGNMKQRGTVQQYTLYPDETYGFIWRNFANRIYCDTPYVMFRNSRKPMGEQCPKFENISDACIYFLKYYRKNWK